MKGHRTKKKTYHYTAAPNHGYNAYHGAWQTERVEIDEIGGTQEDAHTDDAPIPPKRGGGTAMWIPEKHEHGSHHKALVYIIPTLHQHAIETNSTL